MTSQIRLNVKIYTDNTGNEPSQVFPDNNVYIQIYGSNLHECLQQLEDARKHFATEAKVGIDEVKYYIFGDSDAKKAQLALNDYRQQTNTTIRTIQDQIRFLMQLLAVPASAVYANKK